MTNHPQPFICAVRRSYVELHQVWASSQEAAEATMQQRADEDRLALPLPIPHSMVNEVEGVFGAFDLEGMKNSHLYHEGHFPERWFNGKEGE